MMTQEEARATRCCGPSGCGDQIYRKNLSDEVVGNIERVCIASACMGWRWRMSTDLSTMRPEPHPNGEGYCGLAGLP